ncbi:MAG: DUF2808 domain-containing protein [Cyanobacteriota bacterium]|nr:DUF2808 domain-containing protein [Cyanobacteriota bacterium]
MTPTLAIQTKDGTVYFAQPPRLIKAVTTRSETYVWSATYYFTLSLLSDAGVSLERVTITKTEGPGNIRYNPTRYGLGVSRYNLRFNGRGIAEP